MYHVEDMLSKRGKIPDIHNVECIVQHTVCYIDNVTCNVPHSAYYLFYKVSSTHYIICYIQLWCV